MKIKLLFPLLLFMLSGCVSTANYEAMTVNAPIKFSNPKYQNNLVIKSIKGARVTPGMLTEIKEDQVQRALAISLANSGLLSNFSDPMKYDVEIEIASINQPSMGADVEVSVGIYYTVSSASQRKRFLVIGNGYAKFSEYLVAGPRVRFATERAIQDNIKKFIQELDFDK